MAGMLEMKLIKADEITFVNRMAAGGRITLSFRYNHQLRYPAPNIAHAELSVMAEDKESPDKFKLKLVQTGVFSVPDDMSREEIHVATFSEMYPYMAALCNTVSAAAGIPPIRIPKIKIDSENVYRIDFRPPTQNGGEP